MPNEPLNEMNLSDDLLDTYIHDQVYQTHMLHEPFNELIMLEGLFDILMEPIL